MKAVTLDFVIEEQKRKDPEFSKEYQKELLINEVARLILTLKAGNKKN